MADQQQPRPSRDRQEGFFADLFQTRYREVTLSAIVFAILIGVIMNAAITYAGLKIGFTIGGSAIAAVLGFGVLRGVLRRGSILETNIAQTVASAINTSNSGVIFTVPVLLLIGFQLSIGHADFWLITLACVAGAFLGTAFIIPLRKQMLDIERLRFPSPTGVALILKSPGAGAAKSIVLLLGVVAAALIYLPAGLPSIQVAADVDELPELFEEGRISWADAERTRMMSDWIEQQSAPEAVAQYGEVTIELREKEAAYRAAPRSEKDALRAEADAIRDRRAAIGMDNPLVTDDAAVVVARIGSGEADWEDLRDRTIGWAPKPLWGYSDLNIRAAAVTDPDRSSPDDQIDLDGDGQLEQPLIVASDRDQDARPDLLVTDSTIDLGRIFGLPPYLQLVFAIAPFALGAGYITGRAGLFVLAGGILAFFIINPLAYQLGWIPDSVRPDQVPNYAFGAVNRPLGIGLLLGGALMGVLFSLPAIKEAVKSIGVASKLKGGGDELGLKTLGVAVLAALIFLYLAADVVGNRPINPTCPVTDIRIAEVEADPEMEPATVEYEGYAIAFADQEAADVWTAEWSDDQKDAFLETLNAKPGWLSGLNKHLRSALIAVIGALWMWFAGIIIAQCAGMTDWSPISGLALLTVVLVLLLAGTGAVVGAVLIGAALCVAITLAADMMGDMKTGYLVGAKPKRQQVTELLVVWLGPVVCMATIVIIAQANMAQYEIPLGPGTPTVAPQAQALQAVITGVQGGAMPYALYGAGAALGCLLGLGAFPGLGVLIGLSMYLPFMYIATYGVGCVINMIVAKIKGRHWAEEWGVPFAAGLIVGESILALLINIIVLVRA